LYGPASAISYKYVIKNRKVIYKFIGFALYIKTWIKSMYNFLLKFDMTFLFHYNYNAIRKLKGIIVEI